MDHLMCVEAGTDITVIRKKIVFPYRRVCLQSFLMDMILVYNCYDSLTILIGMSDASKILSNDAACPICDQVLSKRLVLSNIIFIKCCLVHLIMIDFAKGIS